VRVGCTLPTFRESADDALAAVREAERAGLDGVFVFDHLWPIGQPGRPSIAGKLVLGAAAALSSTISLGTLVARVGLLPDETLLAELRALDLVSGGRLIAGLGTGDSLTDDERRAYGFAVPAPAERRESLRLLGSVLREEGIEVWVGGGSPATNSVAREIGAVLNLWDAPAAALAERAAEGPTSWGGPLPGDPAAAAERLGELAEAGAVYAVWAWPGSIDLVTDAVSRAGTGGVAGDGVGSV
jgi:alkanesulfonate monooxygenase SsuD/methylene tetrahydromethanopterin reductase-like flavin-dependent oxidoreductase (luciferase family)